MRFSLLIAFTLNSCFTTADYKEYHAACVEGGVITEKTPTYFGGSESVALKYRGGKLDKKCREAADKKSFNHNFFVGSMVALSFLTVLALVIRANTANQSDPHYYLNDPSRKHH